MEKDKQQKYWIDIDTLYTMVMLGTIIFAFVILTSFSKGFKFFYALVVQWIERVSPKD